MCGIVGCILNNNEYVAPILLDCIKKLEYRGYDSVGLATESSNQIHIKKGAGEIKDVDADLNLADLPGNRGIAHVRWATHGNPNILNSHPHSNADESIAVVHNGIIENYVEIKEMLEKEGHTFKTDTDTEVIPHLLEKYMKKGLNLEDALRETINILIGSYAIAAISKDEPNKVVATRKDSPLIVAMSENAYFVASDSPAILKYAKNVIYPEEGEIITLTNEGITIRDKYNNIIEKPIETIDWSPKMAEKEGYEYFMLKEIYEQDIAIKNTLTEKENIKKIVDDIGDINRVVFVACGTSYHAGLTGKYLLESLKGIPTDVLLASEFRYSAKTLDEKTLVIFISQSGETADTLKALDIANETSKTLAIVNMVGSSMTRKAQYVIQTQAGPEIGVAATKTYVSQLTSIYLFVALLSDNKDLLDKLEKIPNYVKEVIKDAEVIENMATKYKYANDFFFIGRGYVYPTALEGALKLKEITYIHGEGYAGGELKHGPLALIKEEVPLVVVLPPGEDAEKTMNNLKEVKARGADVIAIGAKDDKLLINEANDVYLVNPEIDDIIAPLVYIVPLQLLSYYVALEKGLNPDKPRNLAKAVTVE